MKVEYINPFLTAATTVLEMVLGAPPTAGALALQPACSTSQQCNIVCGITGQVQGHVVYGMSLEVADRVASQMLGQTVTGFDQLAASAVAELGNMISGNAMQHLSEQGYVCDITPPTLVSGTQVTISTISIPAVVIPLELAQGQLLVTVGVQSKK